MSKVSHSVAACNCPDLAWLVRGIYRTGRDPAAVPGDHDPWLLTLPGKHGEIFPFSRGRLAVEVHDPRIADRVAALKGAIPRQRGEWFWSFTFDIAYLLAVVDIIQPRKLRRLSPVAKKR